MNGNNRPEEGVINGGFQMEKLTNAANHQLTVHDAKSNIKIEVPQHYSSQSGIISEQGTSCQDIFKISKTTLIKNAFISNYHYLLHLLAIIYFIFASKHYIKSNKIAACTDQNHLANSINPAECGLQFCNGYGFLMLIFVCYYTWLLISRVLKPLWGEFVCNIFARIWLQLANLFTNLPTCRPFGVICAIVIPLLLLAIFLYFECRDEPRRLVGLFAPILFILGGYIFSTRRTAILWRVVLPGLASQWILGLLCLRWEVGRSIFQCLGQKVAQFAAFTDLGSRFVFGDELVKKGYFAFSSLPMIFFFSFIVSLLYHWNVMQSIIGRMGGVLQTLLGTTVCESVNAAANVFLGQTESPLLIRPYLNSLTSSELHAVMVSGFATVSGTVLAAYLKFGASATYLITASVMAAPASLAFSKLYCPETEVSQTSRHNIKLAKSEFNSSFDAASKGAASAVPIVIGITVNLIVFIAAVALLNAIVHWLGIIVGFEDINFEWFLGKIFIPLAWSMGVPWEDCEKVAQVIAVKTIVNEFVAYEKLGSFIFTHALQPRSITIATFAICSFGNPASIGIMIGSLGALAPQRRKSILRHVFRAFIVSSVVSFVSASFAGVLYTDDSKISIYMNTNKSLVLNNHNQTLINKS